LGGQTVRRSLALLTVAGILCSVGSAQQTPPSPEAAEVTVHSYQRFDATCLQWTDDCRVCKRTENAPPTCSNIGTACQPGTIRCTERASN